MSGKPKREVARGERVSMVPHTQSEFDAWIKRAGLEEVNLETEESAAILPFAYLGILREGEVVVHACRHLTVGCLQRLLKSSEHGLIAVIFAREFGAVIRERTSSELLTPDQTEAVVDPQDLFDHAVCIVHTDAITFVDWKGQEDGTEAFRHVPRRKLLAALG